MKKKMSSLSWEILPIILNEAIKDLSMCPRKRLVFLTSYKPKDQTTFSQMYQPTRKFPGKIRNSSK